MKGKISEEQTSQYDHEQSQESTGPSAGAAATLSKAAENTSRKAHPRTALTLKLRCNRPQYRMAAEPLGPFPNPRSELTIMLRGWPRAAKGNASSDHRARGSSDTKSPPY